MLNYGISLCSKPLMQVYGMYIFLHMKTSDDNLYISRINILFMEEQALIPSLYLYQMNKSVPITKEIDALSTEQPTSFLNVECRCQRNIFNIIRSIHCGVKAKLCTVRNSANEIISCNSTPEKFVFSHIISVIV